jgi:hypothetical protein
MDRVGHHQVRAKVPRLADVQCQLLQKKRVAIRLGDDFLSYEIDEMLRPKHRSNHLYAGSRDNGCSGVCPA